MASSVYTVNPYSSEYFALSQRPSRARRPPQRLELHWRSLDPIYISTRQTLFEHKQEIKELLGSSDDDDDDATSVEDIEEADLSDDFLSHEDEDDQFILTDDSDFVPKSQLDDETEAESDDFSDDEEEEEEMVDDDNEIITQLLPEALVAHVQSPRPEYNDMLESMDYDFDEEDEGRFIVDETGYYSDITEYSDHSIS
jgi:hypothetical protein